GLKVIADRLKNMNLNLYFHPDALLERKLLLPNKSEIMLPVIDKHLLSLEVFKIVTVTEPVLIYNDRLLISGEIPRTTNFEKGFPIHYSRQGGDWTADPLIKDDISIVLHVSGKGLLIITGCAHAGLINIIRYAVELTGISEVYAVIGGFHLSGPMFEHVIPETIAELKKINPTYIIPCHCTGVTAVHSILAAFPDSFIAPSVGTTFVF
ncbi:MAG: MBL fold metallo-hydrolase, partial [Candidatus Magnetominusculus sp. LBB02]|nr:MBL fold metallo-hydrolase [Candidatus Magnetominusculus sp. LBB02]